MSSLIVEVFPENETLEIKEGISKASGNPYRLQTQIAYGHFGGKFPVEMKLNVPAEQSFYPAGKYYVLPSSFTVDAFGNLTFGRSVNLKSVSK